MRVRMAGLVMIFLGLVGVDQSSKFLVSRLNFSWFPVFCNRGIAFGLNVPATVFISLWVVAIITIWVIWRSFEKLPDITALEQLSFVAILAGAASNMFDRLIHGCVVDFMHVSIFPAFNLADIYISLAVLILLVKRARI
ncbi:hypothetical protein EPO05_03580 [Patescibacteria group bacterium]|nr:MAG: hypothetical protein EPO05_03580 [Patescibacteria group bacterium]